MNKPLLTLGGALVLAASPLVFAAGSTELTMAGLITPKACTPSLSNGGIADHGTIPAKDVPPGEIAELDPQTLTLTVACDRAITMAIKAIDNRPSGVPGGGFGLSRINGTQYLGAYLLMGHSALADGQPARSIISYDLGRWQTHSYWPADGYLSVASMEGPLQPAPVRELKTELTVMTYLTPSADMDMSKEIPIDGSATLEMKYL
jgi:hypothetical protein